MFETPFARELNLPSVGWIQVSQDLASDPAIQDIEDASLLLPALGLIVAAMGACLAKDDSFLSNSEMIRTVMPGVTKESLDLAVAALVSVGLLVETSENGRPGWRVGCQTLLDLKRERVGAAQNAARARWDGRKTTAEISAPLTGIDAQEVEPFGLPESNDFEETPF